MSFCPPLLQAFQRLTDNYMLTAEEGMSVALHCSGASPAFSHVWLARASHSALVLSFPKFTSIETQLGASCRSLISRPRHFPLTEAKLLSELSLDYLGEEQAAMVRSIYDALARRQVCRARPALPQISSITPGSMSTRMSVAES